MQLAERTCAQRLRPVPAPAPRPWPAQRGPPRLAVAATPPSSAFPTRSMEAQKRTLADELVRRVLVACRAVDGQAIVSNMTKNGATGATHIRVRTGDTHSVYSLSKALQRVMPLSDITIHESMVDGVLEADLTVLTKRDERVRARAHVANRRLFSYPLLIAWVCLFVAIRDCVAWMLEREGVHKDEL